MSLAQTGEIVDAAELIKEEFDTLTVRYGALTPEQDARIKALPGNEQLTGVLWLTRPTTTPDFRKEKSPYLSKRSFAAEFNATTIARLRNLEPNGVLEPVEASFAVQFKLTAAQLLTIVRATAIQSVTFFDLVPWPLSTTWYETENFGRAHMVGAFGGLVQYCGAGSHVGVGRDAQSQASRSWGCADLP